MKFKSLKFICCALVFFSFAFTFYNHIIFKEEVNSRIAYLEKSIKILSKALKESKAISSENKKAIESLSNTIDIVNSSQELQLTQAVSKALGYTVSIVASKYVQLLGVEFIDPFEGDPYFSGSGLKIPVYKQIGVKREKIGAGSGFIISPDGFVITNSHVIYDPSAEYTVLLPNGEKKRAKVLYKDSDSDLALLKIDGYFKNYATLANSDNVKLGQTVVAIGNALGKYANTVSVGIVSGLNREIEALFPDGSVKILKGLIQTDAAINEGNSGGPLINLKGEVVGVNVAVDKYANDIGFAIPSNKVKEFLRKIYTR